jgi:hypothetical protein
MGRVDFLDSSRFHSHCCSRVGYDITFPEYDIGDIVIYSDYSNTKRKLRVYGRARDEKGNNIYALEFKSEIDGKMYFRRAEESELQKAKDKDNLEVGDKFIAFKSRDKYEVMAVEYSELTESNHYFSKVLEGNAKGHLLSINSEYAEEIIYE